VIQMGTITPTESRAISDEIGCRWRPSEAPVLGSIPEGGQTDRNGRWFNRTISPLVELLQNFSSEPVLIGSVGAAAPC